MSSTRFFGAQDGFGNALKTVREAKRSKEANPPHLSGLVARFCGAGRRSGPRLRVEFTTRNRCALYLLRVGLWAGFISGLSGFSSSFGGGGEFAFFLGFTVCRSAFLCDFDDVLIEVFVTGTQLIEATSV